MQKNYILFDLDGTLTDPMVGITRSVQYALAHYGIREPDLTKLTPFIGPPLKESFMRYYHFPEDQAQEAIGVYREYYGEKGIFENEELPGVRQMLMQLKEAGKVLLVATSKPERYAKMILAHFELDPYFTYVGGADMEEARAKKGDVIRYVLEQAQILDEEDLERAAARETLAGARKVQSATEKTPAAAGIDMAAARKAQAVMVGDREYDIFGAKENQLQSVGVLMGYGSRDELEAAGADKIAADAAELTEILLGEW